MTLRGALGSSALRSPCAMRAAKSGFTEPPPDPAKSSKQGMPFSPRVPPKPYGDPGATTVALMMLPPSAASRPHSTEPPSE